MTDLCLSADLDESDPYWAHRRAEFLAVVEALADEGLSFRPDAPFRDCFVSRYLVARFGELTADEVGLLFDLSRQRISAWEAELCSWLRIPMDHAINRDQRVAAIRKHLRQQEFDFALAAE